MYKNYIKIAFRNMVRYKAYSFINIVGLGVGMAACILILLWVQDELSYDRFNKNAKNIYRIVQTGHFSGNEPRSAPATPFPLAPALKDNYPEIVNVTRLVFNPEVIRMGENIFYEQNILLADQSFLEIFTIPFIKGNSQQAITDLNSIVLSKSMADKYFGRIDVVGEKLNIGGKNDFIIRGVFYDIPDNSHLKFDFVIPIKALKKLRRQTAIDPENWGNNFLYTYIQLQETADHMKVGQKIENMFRERYKANKMNFDVDIHLQPLLRIHLFSGNAYAGYVRGHGDILYVQLFTIIAFLILFVACINFMNLATAKSGNRSTEVAIRKVAGAKRGEIIKQFLGESVFLSFIALIIAMALVELCLPVFNDLCGKHLSMNFIRDVFILAGLIGIAIFTGILSGIYPAFFLSSFKIINMIKGAVVSGKKSTVFRKVLVVTQFSLSIIIIISTAIIYSQLNYIRNKKLGLDKENIIYIPIQGNLNEKYETLKSMFLQSHQVDVVSATSQLPTNIVNSTIGISWEGKNPDDHILMYFAIVDEDFAQLFKMEMAGGRFHSKEVLSDSMRAAVINEEAAKIMGITAPAEKMLSMVQLKYQIIGIIKNFNFMSVRTKIEPLVIFSSKVYYQYMLVRIKPGDIPGTLTYLENTYKKIYPNSPFEYHFLDEAYDNLYRSEQRMGTLFYYFSLLAILISCLGLFGLAAFMAEKKTKEIGIRKAVGASVSDVVTLFSKEFAILVIIANIIAWPVAFYAMNRWLQNYAYRINMTWGTFALTGISVLLIALITVSYHAIRAATSNPIDALRYE